ncbi:lantibiotic dehydratase [Pseudonocardia saturnea]
MSDNHETRPYPAARYEPVDFFLLRTPALPVETIAWIADAGDPSGTDDERRRRTRERLRELAGDPEIRRALAVASGDLVAALPRLAHDPEATDKKTRRAYSALLRYLTRMASRPTPFGRFSGVALGEFGASTTARLAHPALGRSRIRADMGWLLGLIKKLEADPELRPHLRVTRNSSCYVAGDRVVLPYADVYGDRDNRSVRIRATPAVDTVLRVATTPVPYERLADELCAQFPQVERTVVAGLLDEMWDLNFLVSDLRPPMTVPLPERYVAKQLAGVVGAEAAAEALDDVMDLAAAAADGPVDALERLVDAQRALVPDHRGTTYQLDSAARLGSPQVSAAVGQAMADAASCLMRMSRAIPGHHHHLLQYRHAFLDRYGQNALVPVLEVLGEDGLSAPPTYTEPARDCPIDGAPLPDAAEQTRLLTELAAEAWWSGAREVELTDVWLERLTAGSPRERREMPPTPALDVYGQLHVGHAGADLDREPWRVVLREEVLAHGGRTYGRFFDLLGEAGIERLRSYARRTEALNEGVVHAELCYLPSMSRATNVALRPRLRDYEVVINSTPSVPRENVLTLDDLELGATEDRFFLRSRRLGREVVVSQSHMLSPQFAPNVARFLLEVSADGFVAPSGWQWLGLATMPFLPRVSRGRVVLHPAQWTVDADTLPTSDRDGFAAAVAAWRERWRVPRHVYLVDDDNRLLLDLDHPTYRDELAQELSRGHRRVTLHEMFPTPNQNWLSDDRGGTYVSEIVTPVVLSDRVQATRSVPPAGPQPAPDGRADVRRQHLPGSEWTFLKIYSPLSRHDEIIESSVVEQVAALRSEDLIDRWFFLRYADPEPHLRVRLRGRDGSTPPELLARLTSWAGALVTTGHAFDVALATYAPEVERYGGPRTFDAVERLFEANSDVSGELVQMLRAAGDELHAEHVAVAAVDALYEQWGLDPAARLEVAPDGDMSAAVRTRFRTDRDYLCELLVPWDRRPHDRGREHHERLRRVLDGQAPAVAAVERAVRAAATDGELWGTPASVLGSLAHMQINRLMKVDLHREARCYALWKLALRSIRGRPVTR